MPRNIPFWRFSWNIRVRRLDLVAFVALRRYRECVIWTAPDSIRQSSFGNFEKRRSVDWRIPQSLQSPISISRVNFQQGFPPPPRNKKSRSLRFLIAWNIYNVCTRATLSELYTVRRISQFRPPKIVVPLAAIFFKFFIWRRKIYPDDQEWFINFWHSVKNNSPVCFNFFFVRKQSAVLYFKCVARTSCKSYIEGDVKNVTKRFD